MSTTTSATHMLDDVIDAMRDIQTEGDRWTLAERLAVLVPSGVSGFGDIIDRATKEGVAGNLSANTLRMYRDSALRWPSDKRVPNVSFSAHRTAEPLIDGKTGSTVTAAATLRSIEKSVGTGNVTVAAVRKAVAVKQGKAPKASKSSTSGKGIDTLADLKAGGPQLIAIIDGKVDADSLDKLHSGLTKVIAHVERLRAKAARQAQSSKASKAPAAKATAAPKAAASKATPSKKAGDLRGL